MRARFPHSDLSDEVAAMVFIPRDASRDPEDEWHFEKAEAGGRLAWGLSPPEPADAIEAAASLHRLARACLGRVAASATADAGCSIEPAPGAHRGVLLELLRSARDASSGRDEPNAQYLILTAALSVIERRCADLYVTGEDASRDVNVCSGSETNDESRLATGTRPTLVCTDAPLLSEMLASEKLANAVVRGCSPLPIAKEKERSGVATIQKNKNRGIEVRDPLWPLRRFLHPLCVNARNVAWHGFLAPRDVSPELAALALAMACSLPGASDASAETTASTTSSKRERLPSLERRKSKDEKRLERCDAEMLAARPTSLSAVGLCDDFSFPENPEDPEEAEIRQTKLRARHLDAIRASSFFPPGWRESVAAATDLFTLHEPQPLTHWRVFRFVAVVAPAVENALRVKYAETNGAPEVKTARLGEYYATLDGYGQARFHDVLLHPRRADRKRDVRSSSSSVVGVLNAFPATLRGETRAALEDLFMRDRGPSLRAAYAHGGTRLLPEEEDLEESEEDPEESEGEESELSRKKKAAAARARRRSSPRRWTCATAPRRPCAGTKPCSTRAPDFEMPFARRRRRRR